VEAPTVLKGIDQMPMYGTSIASTFDNADADEVRDTAISYMVPNRAIYHDGWKAIAIHEVGTSFDEDVWELYNVSEDYAESKNIAEENPDKLKELQELFMSEAEKYNILPLIELNPNAMGFVKEDSSANRSTFKYYPGVGTISTAAAPPVNTNSFTITAPITRENESTSGVIVAMGDNMGGYTLYIQDNKLVFLYNKFNVISKITSDIDVPVGESELKFDFQRTSMVTGIGTLYINDKVVGTSEMQTAVVPTFEGFNIGKDSFLPVSKDYEDLGDFSFTGEIDYVQFDMTKFIPQAKN
jgi:arylsulfatase